jgi:hypothetical protein
MIGNLLQPPWKNLQSLEDSKRVYVPDHILNTFGKWTNGHYSVK